MGKFMRKNRRDDVAVMVEGCLGVRTRARAAMDLCLHKPLDQEESMELHRNRKLVKYSSDVDTEGGRIVSSAAVAAAEGESNQESGNCEENRRPEEAEAQEQADYSLEGEGSGQHSLSQHGMTSCNEQQGREKEEFVQERSAASRLLRQCHSDSCLWSRSVHHPIAAHSRSNSASFTQEQITLALFSDSAAEAADEQTTDPKRSTKELTEASYGENAVVLFAAAAKESSQTSFAEEQREAQTTPGSSSRQQQLNTRRRHRRRSDCSTGWRHRCVANQLAPTPDEIEKFLAGLEEKHKDNTQRSIDKYNFDFINDVPLPGRLEWVKFEQS